VGGGWGARSVFHFLTWIGASPLDIPKYATLHLPAISHLISEFQARDYLYDPEDAKKFFQLEDPGCDEKCLEDCRGDWACAPYECCDHR